MTNWIKQGPEIEPHEVESQSLASHDRKIKGGRLNPTVGPFLIRAEFIVRKRCDDVKIVIRLNGKKCFLSRTDMAVCRGRQSVRDGWKSISGKDRCRPATGAVDWLLFFPVVVSGWRSLSVCARIRASKVRASSAILFERSAEKPRLGFLAPRVPSISSFCLQK